MSDSRIITGNAQDLEFICNGSIYLTAAIGILLIPRNRRYLYTIKFDGKPRYERLTYPEARDELGGELAFNFDGFYPDVIIDIDKRQIELNFDERHGERTVTINIEQIEIEDMPPDEPAAE